MSYLGKLKLAISDQTDLQLFDEVGGTEYDDDESLPLFDNQRILVIGRNWTPRVPSSELSPIASDIPVSLPIASHILSSTLASSTMPVGDFETVEAFSTAISQSRSESWPTDPELSTPGSATSHEGKFPKIESKKLLNKRYWYFLTYCSRNTNTSACRYISIKY